ncbi:cytochrome P450, partial [Mycena rebaudengoi]
KNLSNKEYHEDVIKAIAGSIYNAGSDTTVSALQTFILAMLANPEAQRKAQLEIDRVVGPQRLPDHDDEASLPYVSAIVKEVLRWKSVVPFGSPSPSHECYLGLRPLRAHGNESICAFGAPDQTK